VGLRIVGLSNVASITLPLGPTYLASLAASDEHVVASADEVEEWNRLQVRQAKTHVYFRQGSGLELLIASERPPFGLGAPGP
jgi:hypothetical protein